MKILDELFVKLQPGDKVQIKNYEKCPFGWVFPMLEECAGKTVTVKSIITYETNGTPCFLVEEFEWCLNYSDIAIIEKRAESLYYIENNGCDDTTRGLVRIPDEHLANFLKFIENLNTNSQYECMPTIKVYRIKDESILREAVLSDPIEYIMYLDDKKYIFNYGDWTDEFIVATELILSV